jgi:nitroreductase
MESISTELFKTRRSVRSFVADRMPPMQLVNEIIEAGTYAPTGRGKQSPVIIAVTNKGVRDKLSKMNAEILGTSGDPFYGAPVVLVVLALRSIPTYLYDGSLVMGNLLNAANAVGLGSCWIHRAKEIFDSQEGKKMLCEWGLEGDYEGIGNCVVGYAVAPANPPAPRKPGYVVRVE